MRYLAFLIFFLFSFAQLQAQLGFTQTGKASYYNDRFQGAKTNSGEKYDMNGFTAAHRELPLNTKIKVTNLKNNKSVVVRINDRGPFHHVRILDVSKAAAKELDMISQGVANIKIEVVELSDESAKDSKTITTPTSPSKEHKTPITEPSAVTAKTETKEIPKGNESNKNTEIVKNETENNKSNNESEKPTVDLKEASSDIFKAGYVYNLHGMIQNPKGYGIQVGSFSHIFNTLKYCKNMTDLGFSKLFIKVDKESNGTSYKVLIGDYAQEDDANPDITILRENNKDYFVKKYPENKDLP